MSIEALQRDYRNGTTTPTEIVRRIYSRIRSQGKRPIWIELVDERENLGRAADLEASSEMSSMPLYGIPFAAKDNFDVAGMPTTAACPDFSRVADETAEAVQRLLDAGAILIGKTNMDQFATGLVGTRTPYGICRNVFNSDYISGGSSSGSAVAVASGLVSFSLGTDTAGSGRVPAAFNQLVGLKPTRGLVSTHGLLPACRTLDCVSIFAETCADARCVLDVVAGHDTKDAFSRTASPGEGAAPWLASTFQFGTPIESSLEFFGDNSSHECYTRAIQALEAIGGERVMFDYQPLREVADLLYSGPWVAERLAAVRSFIETNENSLEPTVGKIITGALRFNAVDAFTSQYKLQQLRKTVSELMENIDFLLLPTAATTYTVEEVQADPIGTNTRLGFYTNFVNLLDFAAVAVPAGMKDNGLPFGVSLVGKAFSDSGLIAMADRLHRCLSVTLGGSKRPLAETNPCLHEGVPPGCVMMAVVGAHLSGQTLNWQLTARKARLVKTVRSHGSYRLYVLPNSTPAKPGMVFDPEYTGEGIELEVWAMPQDTVGSFLQGIPAPLCLGTVLLSDSTQVKGFLCEPSSIAGAQEITHLGGWRTYLESLR